MAFTIRDDVAALFALFEPAFEIELIELELECRIDLNVLDDLIEEVAGLAAALTAEAIISRGAGFREIGERVATDTELHGCCLSDQPI